jgi:hypothetical protein
MLSYDSVMLTDVMAQGAAHDLEKFEQEAK